MKVLKESTEQLDGFQRELQSMLDRIKDSREDEYSTDDEKEATRDYYLCKDFFEKATGKKVDSKGWKIVIR